MIRLGVNVDHVATVRNARGTPYPDPCVAAILAQLGGADNITCHLREDRRHIRDEDVRRLKQATTLPLNLEMAVTEEMLDIACSVKPHSVTLVPEKREELTTEGGLDVLAHRGRVAPAVCRLQDQGIRVSLFIEPAVSAVDVSRELGADAVELHTGHFCDRIDRARTHQERAHVLNSLRLAARHCFELGMDCHVGHGLHYENTSWLQYVPYVEEANIGHAIVARAIFVGFEQAVREIKRQLVDPTQKRPLHEGENVPRQPC